jgi:hypothetical protein
VVVHNGSRGKGPAIAAKGDGRRKATSNQPGQRRDTRVSRYNGRPAAYRPY